MNSTEKPKKIIIQTHIMNKLRNNNYPSTYLFQFDYTLPRQTLYVHNLFACNKKRFFNKTNAAKGLTGNKCK